MRKTALTLALFSSLAAQTTLAADKGVYIGAGYTYSAFNYSDEPLTTTLSFTDIVAENFSGYTPYIGYQFNKNFAVEVGYSAMLSESKNIVVSGINLTGETEYTSFYGDLIGIFPMNDQLSLLASIGYERITADINLTGTGGGATASRNISNDVDAARLGLGAEWMVTENIGLRGIVRYVATNFKGIDGYVQGGLGVSYHF